MIKLKDLLTEWDKKNLTLGKVYTDRDKPPFKTEKQIQEEKEGKMAKYDAKEIAQDAMDVFKMIYLNGWKPR